MTDANHRIRVAIVDDHPIVADGVYQLLEATGAYAITTVAPDVDTFVHANLDASCDVLVLDIALGEHNSLGRLAGIQQQFPELRVVVFSMYDSATHIQGALQAGAHGFVSKGASHAELLAAVAAVAAGNTCFPHGIASAPGPDTLATLSDREREVLELTARGLSPKEISIRLGFAPKTTYVHQDNIGRKLGTRNRAEWRRLALVVGLVSPQALSGLPE